MSKVIVKDDVCWFLINKKKTKKKQCVCWASKRSHTWGKCVTCSGLLLFHITSSINPCTCLRGLQFPYVLTLHSGAGHCTSVQHTTLVVQHTTLLVQHTTLLVQHTILEVQHYLYIFQFVIFSTITNIWMLKGYYLSYFNVDSFISNAHREPFICPFQKFGNTFIIFVRHA